LSGLGFVVYLMPLFQLCRLHSIEYDFLLVFRI